MPSHAARTAASAILISLFLLPAAPVPPARAAVHPDPMLTDQVRKIGGATIGKWSGVLGRTWAIQPLAERTCARRLGRDCGLGRWQAFIEGSRGLSGVEQLSRVQAFVNATRYHEDREVWGHSDYWAAPGEFFARGGDCEDYAIAKYLTLRRLGFAPQDLRVLVLRDTRRQILHAVLLVQFRGETLVLDNTVGRIRSWSQVPQYQPLYSVNELDFWLHTGGA